MNPDQVQPKFYENYGDYQVFLVDDAKFRTMSPAAEEFAGFATKYDQKFVPENQIWVSDNANTRDRFFYINNALAQLRKIKEGKSGRDAYFYALKLERKLREQVDHLEFQPHAKGEDVPKEIYKSKYGELDDSGEKIPVWIIDGEMVRGLYRTDYVEGGHDYVYEWIPQSEVWIEDTLDPNEIPYIVLHEFVERELMKYHKMKYFPAHSIAAKVEFIHRQTTLSKQKALDVNKDEALKLTLPFLKSWDGA